MKRNAETAELSNPPKKKRRMNNNDTNEDVVGDINNIAIDVSNDNDDDGDIDILHDEDPNESSMGELWSTGWGNYKDYRSSLIWAIRRKQNWKQKINDINILNKWQKETEKQKMPKTQFDSTINILKEMIKKDKLVKKRKTNEYYSNDSDDSVKSEIFTNYTRYGIMVKDEKELNMKALGDRLRNYIQHNIEGKLSKEDKDWHPDTNETVLDLIHPSLYCYVQHESVIIEDMMDDNIKQYMKDKENKTPPPRNWWFSGSNKDNKPTSDEKRKYQWIPTEFRINRDKKDKNKVLSVDILSYINNLDEIQHGELYDVIGKVFGKMVPLFDNTLSGYYGSGSVEMVPERCQVIVKMANIILNEGDNDKIEYDGGSWHIEGMKYEHIIASGIYYYDIENIRDSYLQFRVERNGEFGYQQNDAAGVWEENGLEDGDELNRYLGKIGIDKEKCICFPNTMQHRVTKFRLRDKLKAGKRKILVFFLIDPKHEIVSTKHVAMQQLDIMSNYLRSVLKKNNNECYFEGIEKLIGEYITYFNLKKAKENRERLMSVRKYIISEQNQEIYERPFSLCEH